MTGRSRIIWITGTTLIAATMVLLLLHRREPVYQGKTVSRWFKEFREYPRTLGPLVSGPSVRNGRRLFVIDAKNHGGPVDNPPMEGLRALGSNAVPYLISQVRARESVFTRSYHKVLVKTPPRLQNHLPKPVNASELRASAALALAGMGDAGKPAVPALIDALRQEPKLSPGNAILFALGNVNPDGTQFDSLLEEWSRKSRYSDILKVVVCLDVRTRASAKALASVVKSGDVNLCVWAVRSLEHLGPTAAPAARTLAEALTNSDNEVRYSAACALAAIGPDAKEAVPALFKFSLNDESVMVQSAARRALKKIESEGSTKAPSRFDRTKSTDSSLRSK